MSGKWIKVLSVGDKFRRTVAACPIKFISRAEHTLTQSPFTEELSDFIELNFSGRKVKVHETWLRHHCKCPECFETKTHERKVVPNGSWLTSKVTDLNVLHRTNEIQLKWTDGHESNFDLLSLQNTLPLNSRHLNSTVPGQYPFSRTFTSSTDPLNDVVVTYDEFMQSDRGVSKVLNAVLTTGFGVISNVNGLEETKLAHDRISHPIRTIYGEGVTVMIPDSEHNDAAYSSEPLSLHTDTTYFTEPMGLQSFHILARSRTGGQTCLSDGFLAAKQLFEENPEFFRILSDTPLEFRYLEEGLCDCRSIGSTLQCHPGTGLLEQIRYNPRHITTVSYVSTNQIMLFYDAFIRFTELLNQNTIWVQLEPGTIIWLDNWRVLHGRNGFTGYRSVASGYFPRSDWMSRARVLGLNC